MNRHVGTYYVSSRVGTDRSIVKYRIIDMQGHDIILLFMFNAFERARAQLPFPPLTNFSIADMRKPQFVFEGVDYDALPGHIRPEYHECHRESYHCLRFRHYIDPVCGYNVDTRSWDDYVSLCQLNLENCIAMVKKKLGMHGKLITDRTIYYLGDGARCQIFSRRFQKKN